MPLKSPRGYELLQGEDITLEASSPHLVTAGTNGTAVYIAGERKRYIFILAVTAGGAGATETLDTYIDWSLDNLTFYNGGHFTQVTGAVPAKSYYMVFDATNPGTAVIDATSDAAATAVRPGLFGPYVRARWIIAQVGVATFTFSVKGYAIS